MRTEKLYLHDIIEACDAIEIFIAGLDKEIVLNDDLILSAVTRKLEIIGEACARLTSELRAEYVDVDWKAIIGFRNILAHQYFSSNLDIVWEVVSERVSPLKTRIQEILSSKYSSGN